jgi:rRNA-processing protein FCF1
MSSHHFVRAEQADCLIVVNRNIDEHLFAQLLEWNPVIVATSDYLRVVSFSRY